MAAAASQENDMTEKEWETARDVLQKFDDRIHDLRKYGFSFVTALLTAQSLLIPYVKDTTSVPDDVKLGVIAITLLLIVTLRLLEKNYQLFQAAAATRALILETRLNLELTETISQRYKDDYVNLLVLGLYILFAVGVGAVGYFILLPNYQLVTFLFLLIAVTIVALCLISFFRLNYPHGREDWTVDPLECKKNEFVRITLTNLGDKAITLPKDSIVFKITREIDGVQTYQQPASSDVLIAGLNNHTWEWKAGLNSNGKVQAGIYRVFPSKWDGEGRVLWNQPLHRKLIVT
jgi:hypothetical protein